jgi:SAM-dependent methyltransferase
MDKEIDYVRDGYAKVAKIYRDQKDGSQAKIPLFQQWLNHPHNTSKILELGCASGFPIGKAILESGKSYLGIDLSLDQINLARKEFPKWKKYFVSAEMLSFCKTQPSHNYSGIISMFSIRHLPRIYHVELFTNIYRILTDNGVLLVDFPIYSDEGRDTWFEDMPMYWSSFSKDWMYLTLKELGFTHIAEYEDINMFNGKEEKTLFLLYQKILPNH